MPMFATPPPKSAEFPVIVQPVSVTVPWLYNPAPLGDAGCDGPSDRVAVTRSTWNTPLPPPLIVTPAAGPMIDCVPPESRRSSILPSRVIL